MIYMLLNGMIWEIHMGFFYTFSKGKKVQHPVRMSRLGWGVWGHFYVFNFSHVSEHSWGCVCKIQPSMESAGLKSEQYILDAILKISESTFLYILEGPSLFFAQ